MVAATAIKDDEQVYGYLESQGTLQNLPQENKAYGLSDDVVFAIPERTFLRKDSTQVVFYGSQFLDTWTNRLTPGQAALIALFDGKRTLGDISTVLQQYCGGSKKLNDFKVRRALTYIDVTAPSYVKLVQPNQFPGQKIKKYNPGDFYIPADQVEIKVALDKPTSMLWMPTSVCQTDCVYCYATRRPIPPGDVLSDQRVKELFEEAASLGICNMNIDGGDALCRPHIAELVGHATSLGISVDLSTKAYVSQEMARQLYDAGIRKLQFGFDAPYPDLFDKVVGRQGHFYRTIESIHNCADAGLLPRTNTILIKETHRAIHDLVELLYTLPLLDMKIATAFRSAYRYKENILLSEAEKRWLRKEVETLQRNHPDGKIKFECQSDYRDLDAQSRKEAFESYPRCGIGSESLIITPDGRVTMCEESPHTEEFVVGSVKEQSILEVWQSKAMRNFRHVTRERFQGTACADCEDFETCFHLKGGCFIKSVKAYGTRYAPHPACPKAPSYDLPLM